MSVTDDLGADQLFVQVEQEANACVVRLVGELDLASVEAAKDALRRVEEEGAETIVLDIDGLRFIDSSGLALLVEASRRSDGTGRLRVTRGSGHVAEMLQLTGIDQALPFA